MNSNIQNSHQSACYVHADLGMVSMLWISASKQQSAKLLTLLLVFLVLGMTCFVITVISAFWDVFNGKRGLCLHAVMFTCEIGVLAVSVFSIREAVREGTFQMIGIYQSDTWFLIFSACMSIITTCLSVVGLEKVIRGARSLSHRMNSVVPSDAVLGSWIQLKATEPSTRGT